MAAAAARDPAVHGKIPAPIPSLSAQARRRDRRRRRKERYVRRLVRDTVRARLDQVKAEAVEGSLDAVALSRALEDLGLDNLLGGSSSNITATSSVPPVVTPHLPPLSLHNKLPQIRASASLPCLPHGAGVSALRQRAVAVDHRKSLRRHRLRQQRLAKTAKLQSLGKAAGLRFQKGTRHSTVQ